MEWNEINFNMHVERGVCLALNLFKHALMPRVPALSMMVTTALLMTSLMSVQGILEITDRATLLRALKIKVKLHSLQGWLDVSFQCLQIGNLLSRPLLFACATSSAISFSI